MSLFKKEEVTGDSAKERDKEREVQSKHKAKERPQTGGTLSLHIPNALGTYDDGYRPEVAAPATTKSTKQVTLIIDDHQYSGLLTED